LTKVTGGKKAVKPKKTFKQKHRADVQHDCNKVPYRRGLPQVVITPACFVLRHQYMSQNVRVDLKSKDCKEIKWLKSLYTKSCPKGMSVQFGLELAYAVPCGDHLEDHYLLVVRFEPKQS
jgi:hypothetical protein